MPHWYSICVCITFNISKGKFSPIYQSCVRKIVGPRKSVIRFKYKLVASKLEVTAYNGGRWRRLAEILINIQL